MDQTPFLTRRIDSGPVYGKRRGKLLSWLGIPFAEPPVGLLRFRAPVPPRQWTEVRDATRFGPIAVQKRGYKPIGGAGRGTPMSEDCLSINVFAPAEAYVGAALPVVVWIYGGAFALGGSRGDLYRPDTLVERGKVIFVSFNYRLNCLGFLDLSRWNDTASTEDRFDANIGLRDQAAALEWVQRNIAMFGGDPDNVTIFGQSAGAMSVLSLMAMPATKGLFHRAFAMSASAVTAYPADLHAEWGERLLAKLGVDSRDSTIARQRLRNVSADELVTAMAKFSFDEGPDAYPGMVVGAPVIDGDTLPLHPLDAFRDGKAHPLPLVIGTTEREGAMLNLALDLLPTRPSRLEAMLQRYPATKERLVEAYPELLDRNTAITAGGDFIFWQSSVGMAESHARHAPTWMYRFDYATPLTRLLFKAATHGLDIPMVFGRTGKDALGLMDIFRWKRSAAVSARWQGVLLDFAKGRMPHWPRYTHSDRTTLIIDAEDHLSSDPESIRRRAWAELRIPAVDPRAISTIVPR